MGEDIHQQVYVKRRKDNKYVNAHEVCEWDSSDYSLFPCFIKNRNYDIFSLFGSQRGSTYFELNYANYGLPDFLKDSLFNDYCQEMGYYGFIWFTLPDFLKAVNEYIDLLSNPAKYYKYIQDNYSTDPDQIEINQTNDNLSLANIFGNIDSDLTESSMFLVKSCIVNGIKTDDQMSEFLKFYQKYMHSHSHIFDILTNIQQNLQKIIDFKDHYPYLNDIININETIFLFFFDN